MITRMTVLSLVLRSYASVHQYLAYKWWAHSLFSEYRSRNVDFRSRVASSSGFVAIDEKETTSVSINLGFIYLHNYEIEAKPD